MMNSTLILESIHATASLIIVGMSRWKSRRSRILTFSVPMNSAQDTCAVVVNLRMSRASSQAPAWVMRSFPSSKRRFRRATIRSMATGTLARSQNRAQVSSSRSFLDGKVRTGLPVEMKASDRVEQVFDLRVRHLLTVRSDAHEESPAEGVGLALLRRHDDAQDSAQALDFHLDRRLRRAGGCFGPSILVGCDSQRRRSRRCR